MTASLFPHDIQVADDLRKRGWTVIEPPTLIARPRITGWIVVNAQGRIVSGWATESAALYHRRDPEIVTSIDMAWPDQDSGVMG